MNKSAWLIGWGLLLLFIWAGSAAATIMWAPIGQKVAISDLSSADHQAWYQNRGDDENHHLLETVAPLSEPVAMVLLGTSLIVLAGVSRRRYRKSA